MCESRGGCPGLPFPNSPYGLCGRKAALNNRNTGQGIASYSRLQWHGWENRHVSGVLSINHTNIIQHFVCQNTLQKVKQTSCSLLFFFSFSFLVCVCVFISSFFSFFFFLLFFWGGGGGGGGGVISYYNKTQNKQIPRIHFGDSCVFQCLNYYFTESVHKGIN